MISSAKDPAGCNAGAVRWQKLVSRHRNSAFVICGHTCFTARRMEADPHGTPIHQILVDCQNRPHRGNGYLRLLRIPVDTRTVHVTDDSPTLDRINEAKGVSFELEVPPPPPGVRRTW